MLGVFGGSHGLGSNINPLRPIVGAFYRVSPDPFSKATFPSTPARLPEKGGGFFVWSVVLRSNAASSLRLCGSAGELGLQAF